MTKVIKLEIILVRHGETNANHLKLVQGWTDNPLNHLGKEQAKNAGKFLKTHNYKPNVAYTSPLLRASETGEIILKDINPSLKLQYDFHFIERNFGPYEQKEVVPTMKKVLAKGFNEPGYETDEMLEKRVLIGLKNLYKFYKDQKIIIFCHSHVIKACLILADKKSFNYSSLVENGSLHKLSFNGVNLKLLRFSFNI